MAPVDQLAGSPVAVGGLGGSGTRLVARLLQELGLFLGQESLNHSNDSLLFTFLFARPEILVTSDDEFRCLLESFVRLMRSGEPCDPGARRYIHRIWLRWLDCEPTPGLLAQAQLLTNGSEQSAQGAPWGWKEPNTYLILPRLHRALPGLRYLHVIRNGVDTAYSQNRAQLLRWGPWLLSRQVAPTPADALSYWCAAHRWVLGYAPRLGEQFLLLNFDRLCTDPLRELPALAAFVGVHWTPELQQRLLRHIRPPPTLGRYRNLGLDQFAAADLAYVDSLGFAIEGVARPEPGPSVEETCRQPIPITSAAANHAAVAMDSRQQHRTPMSQREPKPLADSPQPEKRSAILVVGMHRSGTSALTRVLNLLGVCLSSDLMAGVETDNARGFFESMAVCQLNDELLAVLGSRWDDWRRIDFDSVDPSLLVDYRARARDLLAEEFAGAPLFAIKDPRISRLLPFWLAVLQDLGVQPHCVIATRNPDEVALSLKRRNGYSLPRSHLLWLRHLLDAEFYTRAVPRALVSYAQLLDDGEAVVADLAKTLALIWPRPYDEVRTEVERFLEPRMRHHRGPDNDFISDPSIPELVRSAYRIFQGAAHGQITCADEQELSSLGGALDHAIAVLGPALIAEDANTHDLYTRVVKAENRLREAEARICEQAQTITEQLAAFATQEESRHALAAEIDKVRGERDEARAAWQALQDGYQQLEAEYDHLRNANQQILADRERSLNEIYASTSWRLTAPLRALSRRKTR